jgi:hypothetical protein
MRAFATLIGVAVLACGPIASFRPAPGLMPGRSLEVGAGAAMVTARPYVNESAAGAGELWVTGAIGEHGEVAAIGAFDTDALGVGGAMRVYALRADRVALGAEVELGYAWAALSLPAALRLFDQTFVYTAPRIGNWSFDACFFIPVGASVRVYDGLFVRAEWQRSWQDFQYYNRRDHFGAALAYQF